jgi:hypothetical protein
MVKILKFLDCLLQLIKAISNFESRVRRRHGTHSSSNNASTAQVPVHAQYRGTILPGLLFFFAPGARTIFFLRTAPGAGTGATAFFIHNVLWKELPPVLALVSQANPSDL